MITSVIEFENKSIVINDSPVKEIGKKFSPGFYTCSASEGGVEIQRSQIKELHEPFKSSTYEAAMYAIEAFFHPDVKEKVNGLGFTHKLGLLFYGRQGTGKTAFMHYISTCLIESRDAIVLFANNGNSLGAGIAVASEIREIQDNPIVFIMDEFERYAENNESDMKQFLDGEASVENCLVLAATNYLDKVPKTIKDRPSRFKMCLEVKGVEDVEVMREVLIKVSSKLQPSLFSKKRLEEVLDMLSKEQGGVTIDELKHVCLNEVTNFMLKNPEKRGIGFVREEDKGRESGSGTYKFLIDNYEIVPAYKIFKHSYKK